MLSIVLCLLLVTIELSEGLSSVWHTLISNQYQAWMLDTALLNLFTSKAKILCIIQKLTDILAIGSILGSFLTCHSTTIAIVNNTFIADNGNLFYCLTVVLQGYLVGALLSRLVVLVVSIIGSTTLCINRESI